MMIFHSRSIKNIIIPVCKDGGQFIEVTKLSHKTRPPITEFKAGESYVSKIEETNIVLNSNFILRIQESFISNVEYVKEGKYWSVGIVVEELPCYVYTIIDGKGGTQELLVKKERTD